MFHLSITEAGDTKVQASGSLALVSYASKDYALNEDHEYRVEVIEDNGFGRGDEDRTVLALTADGDTVETVLRAKLSKERRDARTAEAGDESSYPNSADAPN